MRLILLSIIVLKCFCLQTAHGQDPVADSLTTMLGQASDSNERCDILNQLAARLIHYDLDKGIRNAKEANLLAQKNHYQKGLVQSFTLIGKYNALTGKYAEGRSNYGKAIVAAGRENWDDYPAYTYIFLGDLYRTRAKFDSATFYYTRAAEFLTPGSSAQVKSARLQSLGRLAYALSDFKHAKNYFIQTARLLSPIKDSLLIADSYKDLGLTYAREDNDSSLYYFEKLRGLAVRYKSPRLFIYHNIYRGEQHFDRGELVEAIKLFAEGLDSLAKHNYRFYYALALKNIGQIFEWEGDYHRALEYLLDALKVEEDLNLQQEIARTYDMIGWIYANQKDYATAERYARQSHRIFKSIKDDFGRSDYYTLSGFIAFQQKQYERALVQFDTALTIRKWFNAPVAISNTLNFMVQVYTAQGRYEEAMKLAGQVFQINQKGGNRIGVATYYNNMSELSLKVSNYRRAEDYALQALQFAGPVNSAPQMRKAYLLLSAVYSTTRQYPKAIDYYNRYITLSDSMYNSESSLRQAQLNALYELEKREKEIADLNQRNIRQQVAIHQQEIQLRWRNAVLYVSLVGLILLSGLLYMLGRYYRVKKKAHDELNELHKQVQEKNEEIQAQAEELTEGNDVLQKLNRELKEKKEEIEAQSEELREANQIINEINRDLESTVMKRTKQLKEAYKELDTFFYRSSHDFRRPLTTFMGLAEVAKVTIRDNNALELFEKVNETAKSLDKMLIKLQSISDVGSQQLIFKQVLIREIFFSVCTSFQDDILRHGIRTVCTIDLNDSFVTYPAMIRIIIENLVENAITFCSPHQPVIELQATQVDDIVILVISDNGHGIPNEFQDKIFNMYFRGSERSKGNGLGLYIVKKAVRKLGGEISVVSEVGKGTAFTIKLPIQEPIVISVA